MDSTLDEILPDEEMSALYYICGFIAFKENFCGSVTETCDKYSEFTDMVNRGKLKYPPEWLFLFSIQAYNAFKKLQPVQCKIKLQKLFMHMFDSYIGEFQDLDYKSLCSRLSNVFLKGLIKQVNDSILSIPDSKKRKLSKLTSK